MKYAKKKATKQPNAKKCKKNDINTSTSTSTTTQAGPVIEEHILPVSINPYHISKYQDGKKEQRAFTESM